MSPKQQPTVARHDAQNTKTTDILIVSGNGCYTVQSESDSESESARWKATGALEASADTIARFWSKVNKHGPVPIHRPELGACWLWTASTVKGYGQFTSPRDLYGKQPHVYAHRFAYELTHGPVHADKPHVCHHCDQPLCVRVSHLFAGTQANNLADAGRKGRLGRHLIKVDAAGVRDILENYRPRHNGKQLAVKYGITLVSLLRIVAGTQRVTRPNVERVPFVRVPLRGELEVTL